ncbi:hypothetical protein K9U39_01425 [Rhodoblastus acidophilus]|uniref:Uncharacterized protein n=1 Tax=Candidatus Rhodoblastus alkanivorans TaxID=2954117 RepID=A0ABS9Z4K7_9HYPH|nr:hypothetical protein [Candidatus Rhodoblastus alkanivorans]MCI4680887.1 hypothetical protein [Candidatus Rhodoblastus alkanivorans]MCI4682310.1 hypothetical protein [Candidatus Rhodoblastus alkanivorans]MDI4639612.1 hypothetical protein [Rhodoblastus acidophilus]
MGGGGGVHRLNQTAAPTRRLGRNRFATSVILLIDLFAQAHLIKLKSYQRADERLKRIFRTLSPTACASKIGNNYAPLRNNILHPNYVPSGHVNIILQIAHERSSPTILVVFDFLIFILYY